MLVSTNRTPGTRGAPQSGAVDQRWLCRSAPRAGGPVAYTPATVELGPTAGPTVGLALTPSAVVGIHSTTQLDDLLAGGQPTVLAILDTTFT